MTLAETQRLFWEALRGEAVDRGFIAGADRLDVYADMFICRQVDALRADFPETAAALEKEKKFFFISRAYVLAHPSDDPDLGRLGRKFAEFLESDLAALEWARSEVFLERDAEPVTAEEFAQTLSISVMPALRLAGRTAVWRAHGTFEVSEVELDEAEASALRKALDGASFEEVCAAFGDPAAAFAALQSWIAEGWIARASEPAAPASRG